MPVVTHTPGEAVRLEAFRVIGEAAGTPSWRGQRWEIALIRAGLSLNGTYYSAEVLERDAAKFDGARVYDTHGDALVNNWDRPTSDMIGVIEGIRFESGELRGTFALFERGRAVAEVMLHNPALVGFSIVSLAEFAPRYDAEGVPVMTVDGRQIIDILAIEEVASVDAVAFPAAGGRTLQLVESRQRTTMITDVLVESTPPPAAPPPTTQENDDMPLEQLIALVEGLRAEVAALRAGGAPTASVAEANTDLGDALRELREAQARDRFERVLDRSLAAAVLPAAVAVRVREYFEGRTGDEAAIDARITRERDYAAAFAPAARPAGAGVTVTADATDTRMEMILNTVRGDRASGPKFESIVDAYRAFGGDVEDDAHDIAIVIQQEGATFDSRRFIRNGTLRREAITTASFPNVLSTAVSLVVGERSADPTERDHELVVRQGSVRNFNPEYRGIVGQYGNIPTVAEAQPYLPLTTPTAQRAPVSVDKYGGTESMTFESIVNDDINEFSRIAGALADAAVYTRRDTVYALLTDETVLWIDGAAAISVARGTKGALALNSANLRTALAAFQSKTGLGDVAPGRKRGRRNLPKVLMVGLDNEENAVQLTQMAVKTGTTNDINIVQSRYGLAVLVNPELPAGAWLLLGDKGTNPAVEFSTLRGHAEPEVTTEAPNSGSAFTNDVFRWRIRDIFGVDWIDVQAVLVEKPV